MKKISIIIIGTFLLIGCSSNKNILSSSKPVPHELWDSLLQKHVTNNGCVNYNGFIADSKLFNDYLSLLQNNHPNDKNWSKNEQKAYWINVYNAFTIKLIIDNYPVKSIKDIGGSIYRVNTPWAKKFITIEGYEYSLDNIEHDILRPKYSDARVHAAVNCASESCPILYNHAFEGAKLDDQLTSVMSNFIADTIRNKISENELKISKIFNWFSGDFKKNEGSVISFINKYSKVQVNENASVDYLDYLWGLNECK